MVALAGIIMLIAARWAFLHTELTYIDGNRGILFPSANLWISNHWLEMAVNTGAMLVTALGWMLIIQFFNPMRTLTSLPASFFLIMCAAIPDLLDQLFTGTPLVMAVVGCLGLLWSCYDDPTKLRRIFLIFAILSGLAMTQYVYAVYIPVFILGCIQMKIFSLRTMLACLFGLVTPWWIVLGSGLASFDSLHLPEISNFFYEFDFSDALQIVVVTAITCLLFMVCWTTNLMKVITLNANMRAFNGSLSLVSLFTITAIVADFNNAAAYLPLLYLVTSYQVSYSFASREGQRRYIGIILIFLTYIGLYLWPTLTQ